MTTLSIAPDNSAYVQITLTNPITSVAVNDATVTAEINLQSGTNLQPSFSLAYVAASAGIYRATVAPIAGLTANVVYSLVIDATGSGGLIGKWECNVRALKLSC